MTLNPCPKIKSALFTKIRIKLSRENLSTTIKIPSTFKRKKELNEAPALFMVGPIIWPRTLYKKTEPLKLRKEGPPTPKSQVNIC